MEKETDLKEIGQLLRIGILGAFVILAGDLLMGWGVRDIGMTGIESQLSPYLTVSDGRMFWAAIFGFTGVPLAVVGHYGIYRLLKGYSLKYARLYGIGILGFLTLGGAGVHVSSVEAAFFYKYLTAAGSDEVLESTGKFAVYFLLPLYAFLLSFWAIMVFAHIRAVSRGLSPYPRWCWVFSMPIGSLLISPVGLIGNYEFVNALMVGAFSIGNIWTLAGHLIMLRSVKQTRIQASAEEHTVRKS